MLTIQNSGTCLGCTSSRVIVTLYGMPAAWHVPLDLSIVFAGLQSTIEGQGNETCYCKKQYKLQC